MKNEMIGDRFRITHSNETSREDQAHQIHSHDFYEIIFVQRGSMTLVLNKRKYAMTDHCVCAILPNEYHHVETEDDATYERVVLRFPESMIPPSVYARFHERLSLIQGVVSDGFADVAARIANLLKNRNSPEYTSLLVAYITEAIYALAEEDPGGATHELSLNPITTAVIEYIDAHLYDRIILDRIAQSVYSSPSTVCHVFKDDMKTSILQYAQQKKAAEAKKLLSEGHSPITVATMLGYGEYSSFYRTYKKIMGQTPLETQKSAASRAHTKNRQETQ